MYILGKLYDNIKNNNSSITYAVSLVLYIIETFIGYLLLFRCVIVFSVVQKKHSKKYNQMKKDNVNKNSFFVWLFFNCYKNNDKYTVNHPCVYKILYCYNIFYLTFIGIYFLNNILAVFIDKLKLISIQFSYIQSYFFTIPLFFVCCILCVKNK